MSLHHSAFISIRNHYQITHAQLIVSPLCSKEITSPIVGQNSGLMLVIIQDMGEKLLFYLIIMAINLLYTL